MTRAGARYRRRGGLTLTHQVESEEAADPALAEVAARGVEGPAASPASAVPGARYGSVPSTSPVDGSGSDHRPRSTAR